MLDRLGIGRTTLFEHVLDQVNPASRRVTFIAQKDVGWTTRRAKPVVLTRFQYLVGFGKFWILQLYYGEVRFHRGLAHAENTFRSFRRFDSVNAVWHTPSALSLHGVHSIQAYSVVRGVFFELALLETAPGELKIRRAIDAQDPRYRFWRGRQPA